MRELILASASPRRKEILSQVGFTFHVIPSQKEEQIEGNNPEEVVKKLAFVKAQDIAQQVTKASIVIGADTIVCYKGNIVGKPKDRMEAISILTMLSGVEHQVYTGVALIGVKDCIIDQTDSFVQCTNVLLHSLSKKEIEQYIQTKEPMDKAGAYGIQGIFAKYIKEIKGDYYNVVGLPISAIYQKLKENFNFYLE